MMGKREERTSRELRERLARSLRDWLESGDQVLNLRFKLGIYEQMALHYIAGCRLKDGTPEPIFDFPDPEDVPTRSGFYFQELLAEGAIEFPKKWKPYDRKVAIDSMLLLDAVAGVREALAFDDASAAAEAGHEVGFLLSTLPKARDEFAQQIFAHNLDRFRHRNHVVREDNKKRITAAYQSRIKAKPGAKKTPMVRAIAKELGLSERVVWKHVPKEKKTRPAKKPTARR